MKVIVTAFLVLLSLNFEINSAANPLVINTWNFLDAGQKAWEYVQKNLSAIAALEAGCTVCEEKQCDFTVGYGGSPDENGETTLDALIFDGTTINMGAIGCLRRVKSAISVARHVLENTRHSMLVGELATAFALNMGFEEESLQTNYSKTVWKSWQEENCQPNFWENNVKPDPTKNCGPYKPISENDLESAYLESFSVNNHDTIGMIVIDRENKIVAGTSTNGAKHKIPGRVGDSPIPGAGAYADHEAGAAVATGDGDVMMRFLPSFLAVEEMRRGNDPESAARTAILRIIKYYPEFFGAIIAVNTDGAYGAACNGMESFPFIVANDEFGKATLKTYNCNNTLTSFASHCYNCYYLLIMLCVFLARM